MDSIRWTFAITLDENSVRSFVRWLGDTNPPTVVVVFFFVVILTSVRTLESQLPMYRHCLSSTKSSQSLLLRRTQSQGTDFSGHHHQRWFLIRVIPRVNGNSVLNPTLTARCFFPSPGLVKGQWSREEDKLLMSLVNEGHKNWGTLSSRVPGRTSKQCRERWCHHLDPKIVKGDWTREEDDTILSMHAEIGNKWAAIAQVCGSRPGGGRTGLSCYLVRRAGTKILPPSSCRSGVKLRPLLNGALVLWCL